MDYTTQRPSFKGTFTKYLPFPRNEYERVKIKALEESKNKVSVSTLKERSETHRIRVKILIQIMIDEGRKIPEITEMLGVSRATIYNTYIKK